ncbi:hypothetical protein C8R46DRAFT_1092647 [Mycena filopes]|nr:hypothetical protein C8R46DRAFT_1092647 [Mycena filopes]
MSGSTTGEYYYWASMTLLCSKPLSRDRTCWRQIRTDSRGRHEDHNVTVSDGHGKSEWVYDWDRECWTKKDPKDKKNKDDDKKEVKKKRSREEIVGHHDKVPEGTTNGDWAYDWDRQCWYKKHPDSDDEKDKDDKKEVKKKRSRGEVAGHHDKVPEGTTNGDHDGKWEWAYDWDRKCWYKKYLDDKKDDDKKDDDKDKKDKDKDKKDAASK